MICCDREHGNTSNGERRCSIANLNSRHPVPMEPFNDLIIVHTNCQSAMNKKSEIHDLIDANKPHVLALTEFGAASSVKDNELGIDGYTLYRGDHSDGKGGLGKGVGMYVHNSLNHSACPYFDNIVFDCSTWSVIKLKNNKSLLLGAVYRSPNLNEKNNQKLNDVEESCLNETRLSDDLRRLQPANDRLDFSSEPRC